MRSFNMYFLSSLLVGAVLGIVVLGIALVIIYIELKQFEVQITKKVNNIISNMKWHNE